MRSPSGTGTAVRSVFVIVLQQVFSQTFCEHWQTQPKTACRRQLKLCSKTNANFLLLLQIQRKHQLHTKNETLHHSTFLCLLAFFNQKQSNFRARNRLSVTGIFRMHHLGKALKKNFFNLFKKCFFELIQNQLISKIQKAFGINVGPGPNIVVFFLI